MTHINELITALLDHYDEGTVQKVFKACEYLNEDQWQQYFRLAKALVWAKNRALAIENDLDHYDQLAEQYELEHEELENQRLGLMH
jgi:hypothetical protein